MKIQKKIKMRTMVQQYSLYHKNRNGEIYLLRHVSNFEGRYIEQRFYLNKGQYMIKLIVQELNGVDGNGNVVSKPKVPKGILPSSRSNQKAEPDPRKFMFKIDLLKVQDKQTMQNLQNSLKQDELDYFLRVNPDRWLELQEQHLPGYYRNLFHPLIKLVQENLRVTYPSTQTIKLWFENRKLPIERC